VAGGALVLAGIVAAHVLLETARDALFLTKLPPPALPAVYIAMAVLGFLTARADRLFVRLFGRKNALVLGLMGAATGTMIFYSDGIGQVRAFALYLWSGVITTLLTVQFWLAVAQRFTPAQGRRLYGVLAAGGVFGGVMGSSLGALLLERFPVQSLLLSAVGLHLGTAWLVTAAPPATEVPTPPKRVRMGEGIGAVRNNGYLVRVGVLVQVSVATLLLVDYVFKTTMAARLSPAELGIALARYYALMNIAALVVQVFISMRILQRMGTIFALTVLPLALLASGALGAIFSATLLFALFAKGADGALRFSLHRVSTELLFLPLSSEERSRVKPLFDSILARCTQALVAVGILVATRFLGASPLVFSLVIGTLALVWVGLAWSLRTPYLERFRAMLGGSGWRPGYGLFGLNLDSVAVLVEALSRPEENRVITAMSLFHEEGRSNLVPALVLYHPSPRVLVRALEVLPAAGRSDWVALAERLLGHEDVQVRLAAIRALGSSGHLARMEPASFRDHPSLAAAAAFFQADLTEEPAKHVALAGVLAEGADLSAQLALLHAIARSSSAGWADAVQKLAELDRLGLDQALPPAMARTGDPRFVPMLVARLGRREGRNEVRDALVMLGDPALNALEGALYDRHTSPSLRLHIPRAIAHFANVRAGEILLEAMHRDLPGALRYKALRGLGRLVTSGVFVAPSERVLPLIEVNLAERLRLSTGHEALRARQASPPLSALLFFGLLEDKMRQSLERALRLFQILHPREDFRRVYHGLTSSDAASRVAATEILEVTSLGYGERLRGLLRLVTEGPAEPLSDSAQSSNFGGLEAEGRALDEFLSDADPLVAALAAAYAKELDRPELDPALDRAVRNNSWLLENGEDMAR
jgi:ATP:ADP antiporter, AAA family